MSDTSFPSPPDPATTDYDLPQALDAVVAVQTRIPDDALTADVLGTERSGHGAVISDSGLILTIGYLVTEADTVWVIANSGLAAPGHVVGYDQESGFGLVQALQPLGLEPLKIGSSAALAVGEAVVVAGHGGLDNAVQARIIAKQEFAGYWEYLLDEAIFTTPAHPNWGGTAVLGADGTLRGVGSLLVQNGSDSDGNMIVPIDLLGPILDDLRRYGRRRDPARPWLGMMTTEVKGALVVVNLSDGGPAARAGIHVGDVVLGVGNESVSELAALFRQVWSLGAAGIDVPLTLLRNGETQTLVVQSVDRYHYLKAPHLH